MPRTIVIAIGVSGIWLLSLLAQDATEDERIDKHISEFWNNFTKAGTLAQREEAISKLFQEQHPKVLDTAIDLSHRQGLHKSLKEKLVTGISQYMDEKAMDTIAEMLRTEKDKDLVKHLITTLAHVYGTRARKHKDLISRYLTPDFKPDDIDFTIIPAIAATQRIKHKEFIPKLLAMAHKAVNDFCLIAKQVLDPEGCGGSYNPETGGCGWLNHEMIMKGDPRMFENMVKALKKDIDRSRYENALKKYMVYIEILKALKVLTDRVDLQNFADFRMWWKQIEPRFEEFDIDDPGKFDREKGGKIIPYFEVEQIERGKLNITDKQTCVFDNKQMWKDFWKQHRINKRDPAPDIDFEHYTLLAIFAGEKPGFKIVISEVRASEEEVVVKYKEEKLENPAEISRYPFLFIKINKVSIPVRFELMEE